MPAFVGTVVGIGGGSLCVLEPQLTNAMLNAKLSTSAMRRTNSTAPRLAMRGPDTVLIVPQLPSIVLSLHYRMHSRSKAICTVVLVD
jgi:hypothetical protein